MTPDGIRRLVENSLKALGFKPDLPLIHNPYIPEKGKIAQFRTILEESVHDGTLSGVSLRVSNFCHQDLEDVLRVATIKPVVNRTLFPSLKLEN